MTQQKNVKEGADFLARESREFFLICRVTQLLCLGTNNHANNRAVLSRKHLVASFWVLLCLLEVACSSPGLRIITVADQAIECQRVSGPAEYGRPFYPSPDGRTFFTLYRPRADSLEVCQNDYAGQVISRRQIPLYLAGYWGSYCALSPDGSYLAYSGLRDISVSSDNPTYQHLVYVVALHDGVQLYPNGDEVAESSSGLFFFDQANHLYVMGNGKTGAVMEYDLQAHSRREVCNVGLRLEAFPSPRVTKVIVQESTFSERSQYSIYDVPSWQKVGTIGFNTGDVSPSSVVWAGEAKFYYSSAGAIYEVELPSLKSTRVGNFDKAYAAQLWAVDCYGRVHLSLQDRSSLNWAGEGWSMLDPQTSRISRVESIRYIREVVVSPDGRHIVVAAGM